MLHIQVSVCFTYHMHVAMPVAQGSSRALIYSWQTETPVFACVPVRFARGYTQRLLSQRGSGAPGNGSSVRSNVVEATGSPVCFTQQVKVTGVSPVR